VGLLSTLRGNHRLITGLVLLGLLVLVALLQPVLDDFTIGDRDPVVIGAFDRYLPPSREHPLGTDRLGRDALALVLMGLRLSLAVGALAGLIATAAGIVIGFAAAYKGGIVDSILRSVTDMILVIPTLPLLITLSAYIKVLTIPGMALLLAVFSWAWSARAIRSQVLSLKERPYIELAKISGLNDFEIMFKEIMPNLLPYLGVGLANSTMGAIVAETGMRLIGLGPARQVTLGLIVNWAMGWGVLAMGKWHLMFPAILCLILIFISLNFINMGLEEIYNPRLKGITGA
jgi:peptide/nickel transport system permease protein